MVDTDGVDPYESLTRLWSANLHLLPDAGYNYKHRKLDPDLLLFSENVNTRATISKLTKSLQDYMSG